MLKTAKQVSLGIGDIVLVNIVHRSGAASNLKIGRTHCEDLINLVDLPELHGH